MAEMPFAAQTTVSAERTQAEIVKLVHEHGATDSGYARSGTDFGVTFSIQGRRVRFQVSQPQAKDLPKSQTRRHGYKSAAERTKQALAQEERRRWRALLLCIKAKLETVATGIESFESEFLAYIVTDNGKTVYDRIMDEEFDDLLPVLPTQRLLGAAS